MRHYQGHWYNAEYKIADIFKKKSFQQGGGAEWRPLPDWIQTSIEKSIASDLILTSLSAKSPTYECFFVWALALFSLALGFPLQAN